MERAREKMRKKIRKRKSKKMNGDSEIVFRFEGNALLLLSTEFSKK